jgi:uncharacterized protein with beta-barrel porin domain
MPSRFVRRSDGAQFVARTTLLSPRHRTMLLAGTAFTGAFIAAIVGYPQSALAACLGVNTASVTCDAADQATAGALSTTFNGTTVVNVNAGGKIDTGGASVSVTGPGTRTLTFNHNDTIFGITNTGGHGVSLTNTFGAVTYLGNAAVTATGGDAVLAISGSAGNLTVTSNATALSNSGAGISALKTSGTGDILVNGSGAATGVQSGISVQHLATSGGVTISGSGDATGTASVGISGSIGASANTSNILIDRSGAVTGLNGIVGTSGGKGNITITGGSVVTSTGGVGIAAFQDNNVAGTSGSITVGGSGNVNAVGGIGINAVVTFANNAGSVTVNRTGTVTATDVGILVRAAGGGDVTVIGVGNVSSSGNNGIRATAVGGNGNVLVTPAGTVSGAGGISALASGSGTSTVNVAHDVTSTSAVDAVRSTTSSGLNTVNVTAGTIQGPQTALTAASGTGGSNVTIGAGAVLQGGTAAGLSITGGTTNTVANSGTITSALGLGTTAGSTTITNSGRITGTSGVAVILGGANNSFVMTSAGAALTGSAIGSGTDTFRLAGSADNSFDVSQIGAGWTLLDKTGTSNWTLTGTGTYGGPVTVNGGTLSVNGNLSSAASLAVNAGGTLGGTGTVGNTTISGGTLAPGNSIGTLTVSGGLTLTAASTYLVQISGTSSDKTVVTGTANLAGKVSVDPLARIAATTTYTIVTAGTVSGTFSTADFLAANSFARNARLSYVGSNVLLTVDPGLLSPNLPANANTNQKNVATGIDNALTAGASMPAGFNALFALTGSGLANALTQVSGEVGTAPQQNTFNAMNQFMGVMTDPFIAGRGDPVGGGGSPNAYAEEASLAYAAKRKPNDALAAIYTKAPPIVQNFEQRWSVWAAAFGGSQRTDGNTIVGSNNTSSSLFGTAVGADYHLSPNTLAGFALAGGGTNFSVANNLGGGRSDLFQAGAFIRHNVGPAYITGALAYGWQDITTDRTVTIAGVDRLRAEFNANAWSGRVEGGYRFVAQGFGITPYAAGQFTTFDLPTYGEQAIVGSNVFALAYNSRSVTDTRSELGLRTDKSFAMQNAILTLRGRAAWAHDFNPDRSIGAVFQTLPGASFVVNGATMASDAALVTGAAELKWINGWSAAATFEGEFSNVTRSYAGKGVVRYAW